MLWFKKQANLESAAERDVIQPAELEVSFDSRLFEGALNTLLANIDERQGKLIDFVESLSKKQELFQSVLAEEQIDALDQQALEALVDTVFTARRKMPAVLGRMADTNGFSAALRELLYGDRPLMSRLEAFSQSFPVEGKKEARAVWDLGAEVLHFKDPERYPLMTRWVWDEATQSGALREFIANNDAMRSVPLPMAPETFEAARAWLLEELTSHGFYRDLHFIVDLVQAQGYTEYMQGVAAGVGMFSAELGTKSDPLEFVAKLLGVDPRRPGGASRLPKDQMH